MLILLSLLAIGLLVAIAVGVIVYQTCNVVAPEPSAVLARLHKVCALPAKAKVALLKTKPEAKPLLRLDDETPSLIEKLLLQHPLGLALATLIHQTQPAARLPALVLGLGLAPLMVGCLVGLLLQNVLVAALFALVPLGGVVLLMQIRQRRFNKMLMQFPGALMVIAGALRAGHAFPSALKLAAHETPAPLGTELQRMSQDLSLGLPLETCLKKLLLRVNAMADFQLFTTAVTLQHEAGGNLAEVLDNLTQTIRLRFKLQQHIASVTAQSRMTGYLMGAAPSIVLAVLTVFFFSYVAALYQTTLGNAGLMLALLLQLLGLFTIRKLIDIRY